MRTYEITITHHWTQRKFMVTILDDNANKEDAILRAGHAFCKDRGIPLEAWDELDIFVQPIGGHA